MKSLIKMLYYGTLNPDDIILKEDKKYQKLSEETLAVMEKIKKEFGEEKFERISELMELTTESNSLESENSFTFGFRYGAIMMIEILLQ